MSEESNENGSEGTGTGLRLTRRDFLVGATGLGAAVTLGGGAFVACSGDVHLDPWVRANDETRREPFQEVDEPRHWLGPDMWGNRLQDWQVHEGRLECLRGDAGHELRTVSLLTRELVERPGPGHLRVRMGVIDGAADSGFAGFLIGVGQGDLDFRAAALAQRSSGIGGGLLCTYETDGRVRFREHTDEESPLRYAPHPADEILEPATGDSSAIDGPVRLSLDLLPDDEDHYSIVLKALDPDSNDLLSGAVRKGVPERELMGGISLVSSPYPGRDGTRWWFDELETWGDTVAVHPDRTFGPIAGTLFSVSESGLKLTAQLLPVDDADPKRVRLLHRPAGEDAPWQTTSSAIESGYIARFTVEDWDATREWAYRVVYRDGTDEEWTYTGRIPREPTDSEELTIGVIGCTKACMRRLDTTRPRSEYPDIPVPGRYTAGNISIPYATLTEHVREHDPDLLVFNGDQLYESSPTRPANRTDPGLDYLYKLYLWVWSFRELTRDTPTIVLIDDHDVYQANVWGANGIAASKKQLIEEDDVERVPSRYDLDRGGYVGSAKFINRVQRIQTGHNPDPYDPTPVQRGIGVYYGAFTYGGTSFAMLEDRKFKTYSDIDPRETVAAPALLGDRQEAFLAEWADQQDADSPTICLTQTVFAAVHTTPSGEPALDFDSNGFPKVGRDRAIRLLRKAGALVLSGDQHLATLVRHGLEEPTDGVVQFSIPAGSAVFQRWFEPGDALPNGRGYPNTGEFDDAFGNPLRMLAVANPKISFRELQESVDTDEPLQILYDRRQKREGYGIVRVDADAETYIIECWPWDADPSGSDSDQFPGWPYRLPFEETTGD